MLILGAGGLVLQLLDELKARFPQPLSCWSETAVPIPLLQEHSVWLNSDEKVLAHFETRGGECLLAIGGPQKRKALTHKFRSLKGTLVSFLSEAAAISPYCALEQSVVLAGVRIEAGVTIQQGCLINVNALLTHECAIGSFVEIGPGAILLGRAEVGAETFIGSGAIILPRVMVGSQAVVAAGSVVTKDVPDRVMVAGNPARIIHAL